MTTPLPRIDDTCAAIAREAMRQHAPHMIDFDNLMFDSAYRDLPEDTSAVAPYAHYIALSAAAYIADLKREVATMLRALQEEQPASAPIVDSVTEYVTAMLAKNVDILYDRVAWSSGVLVVLEYTYGSRRGAQTVAKHILRTAGHGLSPEEFFSAVREDPYAFGHYMSGLIPIPAEPHMNVATVVADLISTRELTTPKDVTHALAENFTGLTVVSLADSQGRASLVLYHADRPDRYIDVVVDCDALTVHMREYFGPILERDDHDLPLLPLDDYDHFSFTPDTMPEAIKKVTYTVARFLY